MFVQQFRRAFVALIGLSTIVALASACTNAEAAGPTTSSSHRPAPDVSGAASAPPAAMAGGACLLLDFKVINSKLGTKFDVAGAADKSGTYTCVARGNDPYPDLTLSITATSLTTADFTSDVKPSGSTSVADLGQVGYVRQVKSSAKTGPGIEVGWLSGNDRLIVMRYTDASGGTVAGSLTTGMESLARIVDATTV